MAFVRKVLFFSSLGFVKFYRNGLLNIVGKVLIFLEKIIGYVWKDGEGFGFG